MIVVCEKCSTRFRLDDSRVPQGGVKVRCSRCRHRFLVKAEAPPGRTDSGGARREQDSPSTPRDEEPDLENPQFLHEQGSATRASTPPPAADGELSLATDEPVGAGEEPASAQEESQLFGGGEADPSGPGPDLDFESGLSLDTDEPPEGAKTSDAASEGPIDLGDEPDFDHGAAPARVSPPPQPSEAGVETADTAFPGPGTAPPPAEPVEETAKRGGAKEATPSPSPMTRPAPARAPTGTPLPLQLAALAVGVLLAAGALRSLSFGFLGELSRPVAIRGEGWTAQDLQTFHVRELMGERILVVRGKLAAEERRARPRVTGALLNAQGRPLGDEVGALPVWVTDEALRPERVGTLLEASTIPRTGVDGFTLLFREPPADARRIAIQLRPPGGA